MAGFASTSTRRACRDHLDGSDGCTAQVLTCGNGLREDRGVFGCDGATLYGASAGQPDGGGAGSPASDRNQPSPAPPPPHGPAGCSRRRASRSPGPAVDAVAVPRNPTPGRSTPALPESRPGPRCPPTRGSPPETGTDRAHQGWPSSRSAASAAARSSRRRAERSSMIHRLLTLPVTASAHY